MATYLLLNRRLPSRRKNGELAKLAVNMVGKKNDLFLCQFFPPNLHFCFRTLSFVDVDFDEGPFCLNFSKLPKTKNPSSL